MNATSTTGVDAEALTNLIGYWSHRASGVEGGQDHDQTACGPILTALAIEDKCAAFSPRPSDMFEMGFLAAIRVAAAVLADPLRNPAPAIAAICDDTRAVLADMGSGKAA